MPKFLRRHIALWSQMSYLYAFLSGTVVLTLGLGCIMVARIYLLRSGMHTVSSPDLFLDVLPVLSMRNLLVWGVPPLLAFTLALHVVYPEKIPFTLKAVGLLFLVRAFFVVLTPLGFREDQVIMHAEGFFQSLAYNSNDFFFSGHVSLPFLFALIFWKELWIRSLYLLASGLFAVTVLLAHTHYSIDVFAVPFMIPSIYRVAAWLFASDLAIKTKEDLLLIRSRHRIA